VPVLVTITKERTSFCAYFMQLVSGTEIKIAFYFNVKMS